MSKSQEKLELIAEHAADESSWLILDYSEISQGEYAFSSLLLEEGGGLAPDDAVDQDAFNLELPLVLFEVVYHEVESSVKREVEELLLYFVFGQRDVVELLEVRHFQLHERFAQLAHEFGRGHIAFQFLEYLQLVLELLLGEVAVVEDITHELFAAHLAFPLEIL